MSPGAGNLLIGYLSGTGATAIALALENAEDFFAAGLLVAFVPFPVFLLYTKNSHLRFNRSCIEQRAGPRFPSESYQHPAGKQ